MAAGAAAELLMQLAAIFVAAKIGSWAATLARVPPLVGEVLAGIAIANTIAYEALGLASGSEIVSVFAELGVIFLIFIVGLEVSLRDMLKVGGTASSTAVLGVVVPFLAGAGLLWLWGFGTAEAVFVGVAFVATSVGITARVLSDKGMLQTLPARIILGAAVLDDVLGLLMLTIISGIIAQGSVTPLEVGIIIGSAAVFFLIAGFLGRGIVRYTGREPPPEEGHRSLWSTFLHRQDFPVVLAIALCLGLAALATKFGLAAIIGAFLAGLLFEGSRHAHDLEHKMEALVQFFAPFFFVFIGLQVDLAAMAQDIWLVLAATVVAVLSKVIGCGIGAIRTGRESALAIGIGMSPRGEVGIIVALLGLSLGIVGTDIFGVVVAMSVLTTIIAPPMLTWAMNRVPVED